MDFVYTSVLIGVFSGAVSAILLVITGKAWNQEQSGYGTTIKRIGGVGILTIPLLTSFVVLRGLPSLPPDNSIEWIFWGIIAGFIYGGIQVLARNSHWFIWPIRFSLVLALPLLILSPYLDPDHPNALSHSSTVFWSVSIAGSSLLCWHALEQSVKERNSVEFSIFCFILCCSSLVTMILGRTATLAQLLIPFPGIFGGMLLVAFWKQSISPTISAIPVFVLTWSGILLSGVFFAELASVSFFLLLLAPLILWGIPADLPGTLAGISSDQLLRICGMILVGILAPALLHFNLLEPSDSNKQNVQQKTDNQDEGITDYGQEGGYGK